MLTEVEEDLARLGQSLNEKERLCQIANELAEQTMRGGLSAYWWLPLDGIAYFGRGAEEVGEVAYVDLFHLNEFPFGDPRRGELLLR